MVVLVELEEGIRLVSNLEGVDTADLAIGLPVEVAFAPTRGGHAVPVFRRCRARDMKRSSGAAIVGIGQTEFSKNSGRSELQLAAEAVAGRTARTLASIPRDVDGMITFTLDSSDEIGLAPLPRRARPRLHDAHPGRRRRLGGDRSHRRWPWSSRAWPRSC